MKRRTETILKMLTKRNDYRWEGSLAESKNIPASAWDWKVNCLEASHMRRNRQTSYTGRTTQRSDHHSLKAVIQPRSFREKNMSEFKKVHKGSFPEQNHRRLARRSSPDKSFIRRKGRKRPEGKIRLSGREGERKRFFGDSVAEGIAVLPSPQGRRKPATGQKKGKGDSGNGREKKSRPSPAGVH